MNGSIKLPFGKKFFTVFGGPYRVRPLDMRGVKMAAEIAAPSDVDIPTRDFCVPDVKKMAAGLEQIVALILAGEPVYVGCMGGIGRTGFVLALLAKAFGIEEPVKYVRANYIPHAVETEEQKKYVRDFVIPQSIVWQIRLARFFDLFHWRSGPSLTKSTASHNAKARRMKEEIFPL